MSGAPASGSTWWVMKTPCRWRAHPALIRRNFSVVLDRIWPDGRRYTKADIMPDNFTSNGVSQLNLFESVARTQVSLFGWQQNVIPESSICARHLITRFRGHDWEHAIVMK